MRNPPKGYEPLNRDIVMAQAKLEAHRLRREAMSEFWRAVFSLSDTAARSLARYVSRIKMHRHFRAQVTHEFSSVKEV
jgi:hypothetical protein